MPHVITVGYYDDGLIGEVFINGGKSGEAVEAIARDGAVLLSMALQYGVPIDAIAHAITRDARDKPQTIVGAVVDRIIREIAGNADGCAKDRGAAQGMALVGSEGSNGAGQDDGTRPE